MTRMFLIFLTTALALSAQAIRIHGIYLHLETSMGVGGMMTQTYRPYVLLPDGTLTSDLAFYPKSQSDVATWRARRPQSWGKWKESGGQMEITWDSARRKPSTWKKWFVAKAASKGQALDGAYRSIGGGGDSALGGSNTVAAWKTMTFAPNGTVTSGGGSGTYSGGVGGTSVATSSKKAPRTIRYEAQGYTIRLGEEDKWFYRYPDSDNAIGIGASTYSKKRK